MNTQMNHFTIRPQNYPYHDGTSVLSWAVYFHHEFLCYSWSYAGAVAVAAIELIQETR